MNIPIDQILAIAIPCMIAYIVYKVFITKFPAFKFGKKIRPLEDVPRDAMDRIKRDLKKSARMSKPPNLSKLWLSGDKEIPRKYLGRVWGFIPDNNYYTIFYRPRGNWRIKILFSEKEFTTPPHFDQMTIDGRGIEIRGTLFHFVIPRENWTDLLEMDDYKKIRTDKGIIEVRMTESDKLNELWLMRISYIQILCEKQASLDRIEIRDWVEKKAILPKMEMRHLQMRGYTAVDQAEEYESWD